MHGDIKPQNLLVAQDGTVKIADFGLARVLQREDERLVGGGGTPAFQAPEVCAGEPYDGKAADMWALGATVFMIRCGRPPFVGEGALQLFHKIIHEPVVFSVCMCDGLRRLLEAMLEKDPSRRWTIEAVVSDPWLQQEWDEMAAAQSPKVPHEWHSAGHSVSRSAFDPVLEAGGSVTGAAAGIASSVPVTHEVMDHQEEARRSMAFNYRPSSSSSTSSRRRNPPANGTATRDERCPSSTSTEAADDESMEVLSVASHLDAMLDGLSVAAPATCSKPPPAASAALDWHAQSFPVRQAENPATAVSVAWDSSRGRRQVCTRLNHSLSDLCGLILLNPLKSHTGAGGRRQRRCRHGQPRHSVVPAAPPPELRGPL